MELSISLSRPTCVMPSPRACSVAAMFGLELGPGRDRIIIPPTQLPLRPHTIIFITGPSGGGKSSLLRLIADAAAASAPARIIQLDALPALPDLPLVDALAHCHTPALPLHDVLSLLSAAGLGDAFVMLRKPSELSDGQRHRLRIAQAMAMVRAGGDELRIVLADELGATLDRITACTIARNIRRWIHRAAEPICFIAATTHDDLLESLEPDVVIEKGLGSHIAIAIKGDQ